MKTIEKRQLTNPRDGKVILTDMDDVAAITELRAVPGEFPKSLITSFDTKGRLSESQWFWAHKLVLDNRRKASSVSSGGDMLKPGSHARISQLFDTAAEGGLKRPRITIRHNEHELLFTIAGSGSKFPGAVNVMSPGAFGERTWFGRLLDSDLLHRSADCTDAIAGIVAEFADDPIEFAATHGRRSGFCCFCGRELRTDESTSVGYGPVCAERWGLPWGSKTAS